MKTAKNYLQQPYARIVIPVEPDGFHAEILEFPGCFAQGETAEEAYTNLERAAESWVEACLSQGHVVPEPSSSVTYSGRIVLRLPKGIHRQAARLAERDQTSLNTYLVSAVATKVGAEDLYNILTERLEQHIAECAFQAYMQYVPLTTSEQHVALTSGEPTLQPLQVQRTISTTLPNKPSLQARR
jgi:predicted RNase H-like HicB family nuclease